MPPMMPPTIAPVGALALDAGVTFCADGLDVNFEVADIAFEFGVEDDVDDTVVC